MPRRLTSKQVVGVIHGDTTPAGSSSETLHIRMPRPSTACARHACASSGLWKSCNARLPCGHHQWSPPLRSMSGLLKWIYVYNIYININISIRWLHMVQHLQIRYLKWQLKNGLSRVQAWRIWKAISVPMTLELTGHSTPCYKPALSGIYYVVILSTPMCSS